jgi:cyclase
MLKIRIMPTLLLKDHGLVKGIGFDSWRRVGTALPAVKVYNMREVDEIVFMDISATPEGTGPDLETVKDISADCFAPLTVGGGVQRIQDVEDLLRSGADKVSVNSAALADPHLITEAADRYGSQCIVVSIDVGTQSAIPFVFKNCGRLATRWDPVEWAKEAESRGAGEILLTSKEQDGTMAGYDLNLIQSVTGAVRVPVIASGGCGCFEHMYEAVEIGGASAVAAASIFHFTEQTPAEAKAYLAERDIPVRMNGIPAPRSAVRLRRYKRDITPS